MAPLPAARVRARLSCPGAYVRGILAAFVAALAFAGAVDARAEEFHGPAFGNVRYVTRIEATGGEADADWYVSSLLTGETLSVAVTLPASSSLVPELVLRAPDGTEATPPVRATRRGRFVAFRGYQVRQTGRWAVGVRGRNGTEGDYSIALNVRPAKPQVFRREHLGNDSPLARTHTFAGIDGARLDLALTWLPTGLPVEVRWIHDPAGRDVAGEDGPAAGDAVVRGRTVSLQGATLHEGDGAYALRVRTSSGEAAYTLRIDVVPVGRPRSRRPLRLDPAEPFLDPRAAPIDGRAAGTMHLTGRNFSSGAPPRVLVGGAAATAVVVSADGTAIDCVAPDGVPGTSVAVAVVNPDGQAAWRTDYFAYLQPISISDLTDADGIPVRAGSTGGGLALRLHGTFFADGQRVFFDEAEGQVVAVRDSTTMDILTPSAPPGLATVSILDPFGGIASGDFQFRFKTPPTFGPSPYSPSVTAVQRPVEVTILGSAFEEVDELVFDGQPWPSTFLDAGRRTFLVPALDAGGYRVELRDEIGTVSRGPDFAVKPAPEIASVAAVGGPHVGSTGIAAGGGAIVQVDGANFHVSDRVTLGGKPVTTSAHTATSFQFVAPAGSLGDADLAITDGADQSTTRAAAVRYVGYADATSARTPGATGADDLTAFAAAIGDLDRDGSADDLVLGAPYAHGIGTRRVRTRIFTGSAAGRLTDVTSANFPAYGSDPTGGEDWNASALALGDVDRANGTDILIGGAPPYSYAVNPSSVRLMRNSGTGSFTFDAAASPPSAYTLGVAALDQYGGYWLVYSTVFDQGLPRAMALGDIDRDGDDDLVVGRDQYEFRYVGVDPAVVDFTQSPPYVAYNAVAYKATFEYHPATKVFRNDLATGGGFVDRTLQPNVLPSAGTSAAAPVPALHAQDLALGDVDGVNGLDIVLTWDDPTTVSAYGVYKGAGVDTPRVATRVLLNDGTGKFTDGTSSWLPAASSPEFWQAHRMALSDLDGDSDLDLVLLHRQGVDAFLGAPAFATSALRILQNRGRGTGFVDVTGAALPAFPTGGPTGTADNFRGGALTVRDFDGDGRPDLFVSTTDALVDASGAAVRRTRLLRNRGGMTFALENEFLPPATSDTGEAEALLLGDVAGRPDTSLVLVTGSAPGTSPGRENLRVLDWHR